MKIVPAAAATLAAWLAASAASAQPAAAAGPAEPKISQLIIYGNDACPASTEEVIVVCHKEKESDRYRIPEPLRSDPDDPANQAWATRATELQYLGRSGIGSCSTTGPGGMVGCFNQIVREARAEWSSPSRVNWSGMIEDARRERAAKIDAAAEEAEAEAKAQEAPPQ